MECKHHPGREADQHCAGCGRGLCKDCSQAIMLGEYYCYHCAIFHAGPRKDKQWSLFHHFVFCFSVSVLVMACVITLP